MATRRKSRDVDQVIQVIREEHGLLAPAAARLGMSRSNLRKFVACRPAVDEILTECRDTLVDLAERRLHDFVAAGDFRAILFLLSTVGRDRGYAMQAGTAPSQENNTAVSLRVNIFSVPSGQFLPVPEGIREHLPNRRVVGPDDSDPTLN